MEEIKKFNLESGEHFKELEYLINRLKVCSEEVGYKKVLVNESDLTKLIKTAYSIIVQLDDKMRQ